MRAQPSFVKRVFARVANALAAPIVLRFAFAILRQVCPVLVIGKRVIVTRHAHVIELLQRDRDFSIEEINGARTLRANGPFVLSMDSGPQHDREKALLNAVMPREDIERIREWAVQEASEQVKRASEHGRIDLVQGLTRPVPLALIESYFGVPARDPAEMMAWLRPLFHDLFLNPGDDPEVARAAVEAFQGLAPYVERVIAERRPALAAADQVPDDVLGRMLARSMHDPAHAWLDDDTIRRNVSGLIIGALETTSKAAILAVEELLERPAMLQQATAAAQSLDLERLRGYVLEALRFNPFAPIVVRFAKRATTLGGDGGWRVPANKTVYAATLSAMFDSSVFTKPGDFVPDRSNEYLHFGYGLHRCQGRLINHVVVPALVAAVLRLPGLRRARGSAGKVSYVGPFPDRFIVEFDSA